MRIELSTFFKKRVKLKRGFPTGTILFTGAQGAGKSLSASHFLVRLKKKYPNLYIYSNIQLSIADRILKPEEISEHILDVRPDGAPIAFFIDEIQTVLYKKGKSAVSFETFRAICQQRKAYKTIIGTLQNYRDLDIEYRQQLRAEVQCLHYGALQLELWRDPSTLKFSVEKNGWTADVYDFNLWKRHTEAYDVYDTFEIVQATMDIDLNKKQAYNTNKGLAPPNNAKKGII